MKRYKLVINSLVTIEGSYYEYRKFAAAVVSNVITSGELVSWLILVGEELSDRYKNHAEKVTFEYSSPQIKAVLIVS